ncbi:MAG: ARPP-1 family domain-containing protein, partial [Ignavibacteria bacterium]
MRDEDSFDSDQRKIWDFIESDFEKEKLDSPTLSYTDYMEHKLNSSEIDISKIELPSGINGFATFFGDTIFSLEYFSNPDFFNETKDRLLKAILVDAQDYNYKKLEGNEFFDYKLKLQLSINDFLNLNPVRKKSIGAGIDYKAYDEKKDLNLSYLIYKKELIHLVSYF